MVRPSLGSLKVIKMALLWETDLFVNGLNAHSRVKVLTPLTEVTSNGWLVTCWIYFLQILGCVNLQPYVSVYFLKGTYSCIFICWGAFGFRDCCWSSNLPPSNVFNSCWALVVGSKLDTGGVVPWFGVTDSDSSWGWKLQSLEMIWRTSLSYYQHWFFQKFHWK